MYAVTMSEESTAPKGLHGLVDRLVEVMESAKLHVGLVPAFVPDRLGELCLGSLEQAATGVAEDEHLARPQNGLREGQRAQDVGSRPGAGVAEHVRIAGSEAEQRNGINAGIHAGEDRSPKAGFRPQPRRRLARSSSGMGDESIDRAHGRMVGRLSSHTET